VNQDDEQPNYQLTVDAVKWFTLSAIIRIATDNCYKHNGDSKPEHNSMSSVLWIRQIKQQDINSFRDLPTIF